MKWTWYVQGRCWTEVFDTIEDAVKAMCKRQGDRYDPAEMQDYIERLALMGMHICAAKVEVKPLFLLNPFKEQQ